MNDVILPPGYEIGMVGLGTMGRNFLLNLADKGLDVAGYDKDPAQVAILRNEASHGRIHVAADLIGFTAFLRRPRTVMMLVPAGAPVDAVIRDLLPQLERGDLIIDAGNSHFADTNIRASQLEAKGIQFLGVGISGGAVGARQGPSIMAGGSKDAYDRVRLAFEMAAAQVNGEPCVTYLGPGSAGHYVKMVHNGIEYGLMQLIAETYDLMKRGLGLNDDELYEIYAGWNHGELASYLVEITAHIFSQHGRQTGRRLIDEILGVAKQEGTGQWTSESALALQVPVPTIDAAVAMRNLSLREAERTAIGVALSRPPVSYTGDRGTFLLLLGRALLAGTILTFAQGLALLTVASEKYAYNLDLSTVARIWRGGCIIRTALLEHMREAYHNQPELPNLLLDPELGRRAMAHEGDLRTIVATAVQLGLPTPGFMTALAYFDAYRSSWLPSNLIQAQRDYFGAHTYERIDAKGPFHTDWGKGPGI